MPHSEFVTTIFDWVSAHPDWMSVFIFVSALAESLTIIGVIIPGALVMFSLGALIGLGHVDFGTAYLWSTCGAILGDAVSFWIGHVFRDRIRRLWPFSKHPHIITRSEEFFSKHGGKGVLFGRFFGPVRGTIPTVAGMMRMEWGAFMVANVVSGILWAPVYLVPGMVFGASLDIAARVAGRLAILIIIVVALLWITAWLVKCIVTVCQTHAMGLLQRFHTWSRNRPFIGAICDSLIDPQRGETRGLATLAMGLIGILALIGLSLRAAGHTVPSSFDLSLSGFFQELRNPLADTVMIFVAEWGDFAVTLPMSIAICAWLFWKKHRFAAQHWLIVISFGMVAQILLGWWLPTSSHATFGTLVFGFFAVLIASEIPLTHRWMVYLAAAFLIVPMAFARLYLGIHWLTDTLAGLCLGLVWVAIVTLAYRCHSGKQPIVWPHLLVIGIGALVMADIVHVSMNFQADRQRYQPQVVIHTQTRSQWIENGWQRLPQQRIDFGGTRRQAFTMQWASTREAVEQRLQQAGWQPAPPSDIRGVMLWLSPQVDLHELPVLPQMHEGSEDDITWVRYESDPNTRWVLRLWDVNMRLQEGNLPIWVGNVHQQQLQPRLHLFTIAAEVQTDVPDTVLMPAWEALERQLVQNAANQPLLLIRDSDNGQ